MTSLLLSEKNMAENMKVPERRGVMRRPLLSCALLTLTPIESDNHLRLSLRTVHSLEARIDEVRRTQFLLLPPFGD
jgi:hypothetical protein